MEFFEIVSAVEALAVARGWDFILTYNEFETNKELYYDQTEAKEVLVFDVSATPTQIEGTTTQVTYNCLFMLGRKYDADGLSAELEESFKQKYDRRLNQLMIDLNLFIEDLSCDNDLAADGLTMNVAPNMYDNNVDFVIINDATLIHE